MIRMLHAADLHLDSPFAALAPEQATQRREEQRQMVRRLIQECERRNCQLLLLSGDLFDSEHVYRQTVDLLREELGRVHARVFIAPGNHDPYSPSSVYATVDWPENVHIFRSRTVETVFLEKLGLNVCGAAFLESRQTGLLDNFHAPQNGAPSVMVLHGTLGDANSPYNPVSDDQIAHSGLSYLALGHVHRAGEKRIGKTTVGNPGCAMGRGFDETGEKGAYFVQLDGKGCTLTFVPLGGRAYQTLTVSVADDPKASIEAALGSNSKTKRDIYRITLTGTCLRPDLGSLHAALAPLFYSLELIDETVPPSSLWACAQDDSLKGEYLRQLKTLYDQTAEPEERRLIANAARLGLDLMEGREVTAG